MKKSLTTAAVLVAAAALLTTTASAQTASAKKCEPTITVNGKTVKVVEGLPPGKCSFTRTIMLTGKDCPSLRAKAEPPSAAALKAHPKKAGEDEMYHFVCLSDA